MIRNDKLNNELCALNAVLIHARALSQEGTAKQIYGLLDSAEYLPRLIAAPEDETETFRAMIADIADRYGCAYALQRFDEAMPSVW